MLCGGNQCRSTRGMGGSTKAAARLFKTADGSFPSDKSEIILQAGSRLRVPKMRFDLTIFHREVL